MARFRASIASCSSQCACIARIVLCGSTLFARRRFDGGSCRSSLSLSFSTRGVSLSSPAGEDASVGPGEDSAARFVCGLLRFFGRPFRLLDDRFFLSVEGAGLVHMFSGRIFLNFCSQRPQATLIVRNKAIVILFQKDTLTIAEKNLNKALVHISQGFLVLEYLELYNSVLFILIYYLPK